MASNSLENPKKPISEFNIGEIVEARDILWRIDQIHIEVISRKYSFPISYNIINLLIH